MDPSPAVREAAATVLGQAGYDVRQAGDAERALALVSAEPVDLIISEICLPGGDGLALVRSLGSSERHATIPVVILSAAAGKHKKEQSRAAGAVRWIAKPFSPEALVRIVTKLTIR